MPGYKENEFGLSIPDPPYNIISQQKRGVGSRIDKSGKMNNWNNKTPPPRYFKHLFRISDKQIIWGANNFKLPPTEYFIVWNKKQTVDNFASLEYAWTNIKQPAKMFEYSIHKHNKTKGKKIHSTMKPVKLYEWLLLNYAKKGDIIFDSHAGSMSLVIACINLNFDIVAIEKDEDYFNDAVKRVKTRLMQRDLLNEHELIIK